MGQAPWWRRGPGLLGRSSRALTLNRSQDGGRPPFLAPFTVSSHQPASQSATSTTNRILLPTSHSVPNPARRLLRGGTARRGRSVQPRSTPLAGSIPWFACRCQTALRWAEVPETAEPVGQAASRSSKAGTVQPGPSARIPRQRPAVSTRSTASRPPTAWLSEEPRTTTPPRPTVLLPRNGTVCRGVSLQARHRGRILMGPLSTRSTAHLRTHVLPSAGPFLASTVYPW